MKKFPKIVQCDARGQIVIPKDIRQDVGIDEGTGFYMFSINEEGILLKKIPEEKLDSDNHLIKEINNKSDKIGLNKKNIDKAINNYKNKKTGGLERI